MTQRVEPSTVEHGACEDSPVAVPQTVRFDLAPARGGAPYRIFLRRPPGNAPEGGWPVLYLLDGNAVIATAVDAIRVQAAWPLGTGVCEAVVVAVGYPTDDAYDSVRRSWDLGPPPGATYPPHRVDGPEVRTGGADAFLAFIEDRVKPEIVRRVPIDGARQAIFGHSFGGLFVLYALFNRPASFSTYIAASPAIWWEEAVLLKSAARFEAARFEAARFETECDGSIEARVLLSAGEYEQRLAPFQEGAEDEAERRARYTEACTVENARAMAERLDALPGIAAAFERIMGETHMSVLPTAVNQAIRFAFGHWPLPKKD